MADHQITDEVWQHGQNMGAGFTCNYCGCTKRGGGATRFKQYLSTRGSNVKHCSGVPPNVRNYFYRNLDRTAQNRRARQWESLLSEEVAAEGNMGRNIDSNNDDELQHTIHLSREKAQYAQRVQHQDGQYEHGGGSSQQHPSGGLFDRLMRSTSRKGEVIPFKLELTSDHGH
jgi:hypothetical protein